MTTMTASKPSTRRLELSPEAHLRIETLVQQVREQPESAAAFVELARAYAEVWANNGSSETFARVERGLERSIDLDAFAFETQIREILEYMTGHARTQKLADAAIKLRALDARLKARLEVIRNAFRPAQTIAEPEPPAPEAPKPAAPPTPWASTLGPAIFAAPPPPPPPPAPVLSAATLQMSGVPEESDDSEGMGFESLVGAAFSQDGEIEGADDDSLGSVGEAEDASPDVAAASLPDPELMAQIDRLFAENQIDEVLKLYPALHDARLKRTIIGRFAEGIAGYRIGPLLAIGAMESDKRVFRHMISLLLGGDRAGICQQIDFAQLSPDLSRVGVVVLSQMKSRAALPRLQEALRSEDPVVRSVALHGIGSAGDGAQGYIPLLVSVARDDPHPQVRQNAAKAIDTLGTSQAYEALQTAALETHLDPAVLKVVEAMRLKFDPDGARLARKVAKAGKAQGATPDRVRDAEKMLASHQRMLKRAKEKADRDPEVIAARARRAMLTKVAIYFVVVVLPACYVFVRFMWPVLHALATKATEGPHYND